MSERDEKIYYSVLVILEEKIKEKIVGFSDYIENLYDMFLSREKSFEILIIANGAEGLLRNELHHVEKCRTQLRTFALSKKVPQAVCLTLGFKETAGDIIVVCGPYQQLTNDSFIGMLDAFTDDIDILTPCRENRHDPRFNQLQSRVFNRIVRFITKSDVHDLSCNVKMFRRFVLEDIKLYGNMYLFLPILAERKGYKNKEIQCANYQAIGRTGFYTLSEYFTRMIDIFTLYFNTRFAKKPLRFFSAVGALFILISVLIIFHLCFQKFFLGYGIGNRPALLISVIFMVFGVQAASVGLLGEIIVFIQGRHMKGYNIERYVSAEYSGPERRKDIGGYEISRAVNKNRPDDQHNAHERRKYKQS